MKRVPIIQSQSERYLMLLVPSKSRPGVLQVVQYKPNGDRECSCPGAYWFKEKGQDLYKSCRHQKMTTIKYETIDALALMCGTKLMFRHKKIPLYVIWGQINCSFSEHRNEDGIHCNSCPLYPAVCNIRKIKTGRGPRARLPLIWRLQTACYGHERTLARKLINKIIAAIRKVKT